MKTCPQTIMACDLFCGSGGTSTGLLQAADALGLTVELVAVNHWQTAIETHTANHPGVTHYCEDLETVNPRKAVPGGHLHLLVASPACTHHSNARGGKPMNEQSRATAWHIVRWAEELYIDHILIENVREFRDWGPLHSCTCDLGHVSAVGPHQNSCKMGRPIKEKKGEFYRLFLHNLRKLGYTVSERILNAANFGDATTRERLFIQARHKSGAANKSAAIKSAAIKWPTPSHIKPVSGGIPGLMEGLPTWRPARDIIDWSLESKSIYTRKRPLAPATMARIFAGLRKYSGLPFIVPQFASQGARDIERPIGTLTTQSRGVGLCEPFFVKFYQGSDAASIDAPVPTITANYEHLGLAEPFLIGAGGPVGAGNPSAVSDPLGTVLTQNHRGLVEPYLVVLRQNADGLPLSQPVPTLTTGGNMALCEPFIVPTTHSGGPERSHDVNLPLPTVTTAHRGELAVCEPIICEPFLTALEHSSEGHDRRCYHPDRPLPTVTSNGRFGLIEPYLTEFHGGANSADRTRSVEEPVCTLDTSNRVGLAQPFLVNYFGNGQALSLEEPLDTITARDRFALVDPCLVADGYVDKGEIIGYLDIRFRMLQPHELAAAMSFPKTYHFAGNREDRVKQIGNSVAVGTAQALCVTILRGLV